MVTNRMPAGEALVENLATPARVHVPEEPRFEVAAFGGGSAEFISNQTLVRADERIALELSRPQVLALAEKRQQTTVVRESG